MANMVDSFGKNAGKIWEILSSDISLTEDKLIKKTKLKNQDFYSAVGWLARENKICKDYTFYKLGPTNLTGKIGKDAGKVWLVLDVWGKVDLSSISRLARIKEKDVFSAVGWLAREGKIDGDLLSKKGQNIKFWLK